MRSRRLELVKPRIKKQKRRTARGGRPMKKKRTEEVRRVREKTSEHGKQTKRAK